MNKILNLLSESNCKMSDDSIKNSVAGVLAAPKPRAKSQQSLWQSLFDGDISHATEAQLNAELESLRSDYDVGLMDGPVPTSRKDAVLGAIQSLGVDGTIVTLTDEYQGEYLPDQARRLYWLTGFAGSAGLCFVGQKKSAIFVDGRYTVQVTEQVDGNDYDYCHLINDPIGDWIVNHYPSGSRIGFNPYTMADTQARAIKSTLESAGIALIALETDPIDRVWDNQPVKPISPILPHPMDYTGQSSADKHAELVQTLIKNGADGAVVCLPDSVCWLLNIRGGDVPCTPFVHGYMVITHEDIHLFVDNRKIPPKLTLPAVVHGYDDFENWIATHLGGKTVMVDGANTPYKIAEILRQNKATLKNAIEICQIPKACKNTTEIAGARQAHVVDGVAMVKFLHWLDTNVAKGLQSGDLTELSCAEKLTAIRMQHPDMRDVSFEPISAVAENGAICHYRVTEDTSKPLSMDTLYLVDSGGQYEYGTTDITRTIALGTISDEHRDRATRVLKGMIALHRIKFAHGTSGMSLDILARQYLYAGGYNFDHGTGHGIGSYLSVHEGPARISPKASPVALKPGMILSNEPGYYKAGGYGIRLENLIVVTACDETYETPMLYFENLTWCPLDTRLFDVSMLTGDEKQWLNTYHRDVWDKLSPHIEDKDVLGWLKNATKAI